MLVVHPIGIGQAGYYQHEPGEGLWRGHGHQSLELPAEVGTASLRAVLGGREPGGELLLRRLPAQRRAGFDLIFAAPKSVSLLAELAPPAIAPRLQSAHREAVDAAVGYLERQATWARRGPDHERIPTSGLVAAAFVHHWSAAADPHLHTHLVVANLVQGNDGVWSCLDSRALYHHAGAAGAIFGAALRQALADQGLSFGWHVQRNGLADIAAVPRSAIDACSVRHRQVTAEISAGMAGAAGRATAAGRTRGQAAPDAKEAWPVRAARAGLDRELAAEVMTEAAQRRSSPAMAPAPEVTDRALAELRSRFGRPDVVQVMARLTVRGAGPKALERWADDYLGTAVKIGVGPRGWTTPGSRQLEERIASLAATGRSRTSTGLARADAVGAVLSQRPDLSPTGRNAMVRLTTEGSGVVRVAGGDFVGQAFVLDAAHSAWAASGHRVAVVCHDQRRAARWQAMTAIGSPPPLPAHPTVVLVDGADRCSTAELHRILNDGVARNAKVVLIDGGTSPARRQAESPAMDALRKALPALDCGRAGPETALGPGGPVVRAGRDGAVAIVRDGPAAAGQLVAEWHQARAGSAQGSPTMVALGPDEAEYLNAAARIGLRHSGEVFGPAIDSGRRQFQAGDQVRALRRDPRLGGVSPGTTGVVTNVDPHRNRLTIAWPTGDLDVTGAQLARAPLTHAYATTPSYMRGTRPGPVLCLGDPSTVAPRLAPDHIAQVVTPAQDRCRPDPLRQLLMEQPPTCPAPPAPAEAANSLADLYRDRDQLADRLRAELPPDPGPELRRVTEERDSLQPRRHLPDAERALAALDHRQAHLTAAAQFRSRWIEDHRPQLVRWEDLDGAIAWRENALARAAEIRPSRAVVDELGLPPPGDSQRRGWRQAAGAIEAYRERWAVADQPLAVDGRAPSPRTPSRQPGREVLASGPDAARGVDELRTAAGRRALEQSRGQDRVLGL